jgi:predicted site-specific integrase-resolvase
MRRVINTKETGGRLWRLSDLASHCGVVYMTAWGWVKKGKLRSVRLANGSLRIPHDEVVNFLRGRLTDRGKE